MVIKERKEQVLRRAHISGRLWNMAATLHLALLIVHVQSEIWQCSVLFIYMACQRRKEGRKEERKEGEKPRKYLATCNLLEVILNKIYSILRIKCILNCGAHFPSAWRWSYSMLNTFILKRKIIHHSKIRHHLNTSEYVILGSVFKTFTFARVSFKEIFYSFLLVFVKKPLILYTFNVLFSIIV